MHGNVDLNNKLWQQAAGYCQLRTASLSDWRICAARPRYSALLSLI